MADYTATTNYSFKMPTDHGNTNTWGGYNNSNWSAVDGLIASLNTGVFSSNQLVLNKATVAAGNPIYGKFAGSTRWVIELGDPTAEGGSNSGSNFAVYAFDDSGAYLSTPLTIARANGAVTVGSVTATGNLTVNGVVSGGTTLYPAYAVATNWYLTQSSGYRINNWATNWADRWNTTTGLRDWTAPAGVLMSLDINGILTVASATAYKPGGGSWTAPSDARIKDVAGEYELGLDQVLQLRPVRYRYKGNDAAPDGSSSTKQAAGKPFVGFVAQELEAIMPDMVTKHDGYVDGKKVSDLRSVDVSELVFVLVNAVKELKAEIEELKAAR